MFLHMKLPAIPSSSTVTLMKVVCSLRSSPANQQLPWITVSRWLKDQVENQQEALFCSVQVVLTLKVCRRLTRRVGLMCLGRYPPLLGSGLRVWSCHVVTDTGLGWLAS